MEISPLSPPFKGFQDVCTLRPACMSTRAGIRKLPTLTIADLPGDYALWRSVSYFLGLLMCEEM